MQKGQNNSEHRIRTQLAEFAPVAGVPVQRQIPRFIRQLIQSEKLLDGDRLPPMKELAALWNTNHFTVNNGLRPLVQEGLLIWQRRVGTFVRSVRRPLTSVGLYHNSRLELDSYNSFPSLLHMEVYKAFSERGVACMSWFDRRTEAEQTEILPQMSQAIQEGLIQALVVTTAIKEDIRWLTRLKVPVSINTPESVNGSVWLDAEAMVERALDVLQAKGCRHVAIITHDIANDDSRAVSRQTPVAEIFREAASRRRLSIESSALIPPSHGKLKAREDNSFEKFGYAAFKDLWSRESRPDGIFIFPDVLAVGVFGAALEHDVRVPADLVMVSHRNEENMIFCPFPVEWISFRIRDFASALIKQIEKQLAGEEVGILEIPPVETED